jgi:hypothetical protein
MTDEIGLPKGQPSDCTGFGGAAQRHRMAIDTSRKLFVPAGIGEILADRVASVTSTLCVGPTHSRESFGLGSDGEVLHEQCGERGGHQATNDGSSGRAFETMVDEVAAGNLAGRVRLWHSQRRRHRRCQVVRCGTCSCASSCL